MLEVFPIVLKFFSVMLTIYALRMFSSCYCAENYVGIIDAGSKVLTMPGLTVSAL